jgi:uncharacterized protein YcbK (DUF882 family)
VKLALVLVATAATAHATGYVSKKDASRATKSHKHGKPPAPGMHAAPLLNLYNQWTHDWLAVDPHDLPPRSEVDVFLRDHYTNKATAMDAKLIHFLVDAAQHFHADTVDVVSGFRHPKYNLILRKKGHQVARDSQHTHGNAVDFYLPHVTTRELHAWAKARHAGGVGIYLESGFVHMDTGAVRYWSGD